MLYRYYTEVACTTSVIWQRGVAPGGAVEIVHVRRPQQPARSAVSERSRRRNFALYCLNSTMTGYTRACS